MQRLCMHLELASTGFTNPAERESGSEPFLHIGRNLVNYLARLPPQCMHTVSGAAHSSALKCLVRLSTTLHSLPNLHLTTTYLIATAPAPIQPLPQHSVCISNHHRTCTHPNTTTTHCLRPPPLTPRTSRPPHQPAIAPAHHIPWETDKLMN